MCVCITQQAPLALSLVGQNILPRERTLLEAFYAPYNADLARLLGEADPWLYE